MQHRLLFGTNNVVNIDDIVDFEEKTITLSIAHTKKNPTPKPTKGFLAKLMYSDTITYHENESYFCLILKVKRGTQMIGNVDSSGNLSARSNQLYGFFTIYNDEKFLMRLKGNNSNERQIEIGNFYHYPGVLHYPDYLNTNMMLDQDIKSKDDFVNKYIL